MATASVRTELAVEMTCEACVKSLRGVLEKIEGVSILEIDLDSQKAVIEGTASILDVCQKIKDVGLTVVVRGQGTESSNLGAAVSILETSTPNDVKGLIRFVQLNEFTCVIDVSLSGIPPGKHAISIHQFGDFTRGCESCGPHFNPKNTKHGGREEEERHVGDLGNINISERGEGSLIIQDPQVKVWDIIGRSCVLHEKEDDSGKGENPQSKIDGNSGPGIAWGVIARSAGLFENQKKVCLCTGRTIWEQAKFGSVLE